MDNELEEYLENLARRCHRKFDQFEAELHGLREDLRDFRQEVHAMCADVSEHSHRIGYLRTDYYEARRVRDLRTIGLEARVNELERRLSELEGGRG